MHSYSDQGHSSFFTSLYRYGECPSSCFLLFQRPHGGAALSVSLNSHLSDGTPPTQKLKGTRGVKALCVYYFLKFVIPFRSTGVRVQCRFTSTETIWTIRDGETRTATSTFTQLLSSADNQVQCWFTSTETTRTIGDREPRTATSTFTQLLSSVTSMLLYVHRDHRDC